MQNSDKTTATTDEKQAAKHSDETLANYIRDSHAAAVLATTQSKTLGKFVSSKAFVIFMQNELNKAQNPDDPLERMAIQQMVLIHFRIADLHAWVSQTTDPKELVRLESSIVRLTAEYRKMFGAIKQYRSPKPAAPQHVTVVEQQNVAHGDQQIAVFPGAEPTEQPTAAAEPAEQVVAAIPYAPTPDFFAEAKKSRRKKEPVPAHKVATHQPLSAVDYHG
jgi:hypothetical protein